jgi:hypothetical protein
VTLGGGAISIRSQLRNLIPYFMNCEFKKNKVSGINSRGGAIYFEDV